jgi:hypothetical protein
MEMENDCIIWTGYIGSNGYGVKKIKGKSQSAHRLAYAEANGPIPDGAHIDHLCRNRACVNPEHLEAVDLITNIMRGEGIMAQNARKTECKRGHEFTPENTMMTKQGGRSCRECGRIRNREWYARNIEQQRARGRRRSGSPYGPST